MTLWRSLCCWVGAHRWLLSGARRGGHVKQNGATIDVPGVHFELAICLDCAASRWRLMPFPLDGASDT